MELMMLRTSGVFGRVLLAACLTVSIPVSLRAEDKKELTELQKLKAENFKLKVQLVQLNATLQDRENKLASIELTQEQAKLNEEFIKQLGCKKDESLNWDSLICAAKPKSSTDSNSANPN
jgi:predicted nuclease with TOPRIM domain